MKHFKSIYLYSGLIFILFVTGCQYEKRANKQHLYGELADSAMVVSAHPLASQIGKEILKNGGNAYDAGIAVHFALAVAYPRAGNIGGGGFAVIRTQSGAYTSLDFREKAAKRAHKDMYLDSLGNVIEDLNRAGHLAAGVPGSVAGMWELHQKFGKLDWKTLIQPSIDLALTGVELTDSEAAILNRYSDELRHWNNGEFNLVQNDKWKKGDIVVYADLAKTLTLIQSEGRDGFYKGQVAELIAKEMSDNDGFITEEDLIAYEAKWREPLIGSYKGYKIISMPPPSSGGIALLQLLQGSDMVKFSELGHNTVKSIHTMVELERRVYADRATYLGDPDFVDVPVDMLLDPKYNKNRFSSINKSAKTPSGEIKEGHVEVIESVETTHYSVVDQWGNALAVTTTLNANFGCKVAVDGAGFLLNNEMDDFSAKPGVPNRSGLVGAEANAIHSEKRMLSSMTPTILEKDGKLQMVLGTPGGSTIITSIYQTVLNVIDHGMTMQEAVNAKKIHHQWLPDHVIIEKGAIDSLTWNDLEKMGHELKTRKSLGRLDCIRILEDNSLEGAADYTRGDDFAVGY